MLIKFKYIITQNENKEAQTTSVQHNELDPHPHHSQQSLCYVQLLQSLEDSHSLHQWYPIIYKYYDLRKHLQKVEFSACWTITIVAAATYMDRTLSSETLLYYSSLYLKASVVFRALAYASDFSNASERFSGRPPFMVDPPSLWMPCATFSKAVFLLDAGSRSQIIVFALASQSSHNTWTK